MACRQRSPSGRCWTRWSWNRSWRTASRSGGRWRCTRWTRTTPPRWCRRWGGRKFRGLSAEAGILGPSGLRQSWSRASSSAWSIQTGGRRITWPDFRTWSRLPDARTCSQSRSDEFTSRRRKQKFRNYRRHNFFFTCFFLSSSCRATDLSSRTNDLLQISKKHFCLFTFLFCASCSWILAFLRLFGCRNFAKSGARVRPSCLFQGKTLLWCPTIPYESLNQIFESCLSLPV